MTVPHEPVGRTEYVVGLEREVERLRRRVEAVGALIEKNGCDCDCDHDVEGHDGNCERCLACRISETLWPPPQGAGR